MAYSELVEDIISNHQKLLNSMSESLTDLLYEMNVEYIQLRFCF